MLKNSILIRTAYHERIPVLLDIILYKLRFVLSCMLDTIYKDSCTSGFHIVCCISSCLACWALDTQDSCTFGYRIVCTLNPVLKNSIYILHFMLPSMHVGHCIGIQAFLYFWISYCMLNLVLKNRIYISCISCCHEYWTLYTRIRHVLLDISYCMMHVMLS